MSRIKKKVREWAVRFAPAEIVGTIAALVCTWVVREMTGSLAVAAVAGAIGETIGYYLTVIVRSALHYYKKYREQVLSKRLRSTVVYTAGDIVTEFGPPELLDSLIVRPWLFYVMPHHIGHYGLAIFVGKLLSDVVFYALAIILYESKHYLLRRRMALAQERSIEEQATL